jgi:hypothetical protein
MRNSEYYKAGIASAIEIVRAVLRTEGTALTDGASTEVQAALRNEYNLPIGYTLSLSELDGTLVLDSQELEPIEESIPFHQFITGAVVKTSEGDYTEVWITESNRPFDTNTIYEKVL